MATINVPKVVVGGIVAGIVFNIGDFIINNVIMAADFAQAVTRLGLDPNAMQTLSGALPWIVLDFCWGWLIVFTYAAIRSRFGAGVQTAVIAAAIPFLSSTFLFLGFTSMGMFPASLFVKNTLLSVVTVGLGSVAGAWVYKEEDAQIAARSRVGA